MEIRAFLNIQRKFSNVLRSEEKSQMFKILSSTACVWKFWQAKSKYLMTKLLSGILSLKVLLRQKQLKQSQDFLSPMTSVAPSSSWPTAGHIFDYFIYFQLHAEPMPTAFRGHQKSTNLITFLARLRANCTTSFSIDYRLSEKDHFKVKSI